MESNMKETTLCLLKENCYRNIPHDARNLWSEKHDMLLFSFGMKHFLKAGNLYWVSIKQDHLYPYKTRFW